MPDTPTPPDPVEEPDDSRGGTEYAGEHPDEPEVPAQEPPPE